MGNSTYKIPGYTINYGRRQEWIWKEIMNCQNIELQILHEISDLVLEKNSKPVLDGVEPLFLLCKNSPHAIRSGKVG